MISRWTLHNNGDSGYNTNPQCVTYERISENPDIFETRHICPCGRSLSCLLALRTQSKEDKPKFIQPVYYFPGERNHQSTEAPNKGSPTCAYTRSLSARFLKDTLKRVLHLCGCCSIHIINLILLKTKHWRHVCGKCRRFRPIKVNFVVCEVFAKEGLCK